MHTRTLVATAFILFSCLFVYEQEPTSTPSGKTPEIKMEPLLKLSRGQSLKDLSEGTVFESKNDGFRIHLPLGFSGYKSPKSAPPGGYPTPGRVSWDLTEAYIEISITEMPKGLVATWSGEQRRQNLTDALNAGIASANGKKIYEREVTVGGLAGREAKITVDGATMLARCVYINDRLYLLAALLLNAPDSEALVKKAFDTFAPAN